MNKLFKKVIEKFFTKRAKDIGTWEDNKDEFAAWIKVNEFVILMNTENLNLTEYELKHYIVEQYIAWKRRVA